MSQETVLEEAKRIVDGDRRADYGHPYDNHTCTADMWTAWARRRGLLAHGKSFTADVVCTFNRLQKESRNAHAPGRDHLVDIAGYARNEEIVVSHKAKP